MRPEQFAQMYGLNVQTIRAWCKDGKLSAKKIGGQWFIDVEKSLKP